MTSSSSLARLNLGLFFYNPHNDKYMSNLQEKVNKEYPLYDIPNSVSRTDEYNGNEIQLLKRSAFQNGYEQCQKEFTKEKVIEILKARNEKAFGKFQKYEHNLMIDAITTIEKLVPPDCFFL